MNIILGDGIAGYIIAACLDHEGENFIIYGNNTFKAPDILILKTDAEYWQVDEYYTNDYLIKEYFELFKIEDNKKNRKKYLKHIKIGYRTIDAIITNKPSQTDLEYYYKKQGRVKTKSSMSDGQSSFIALDLKKVYEKLQKDYKKHFKHRNISQGFIDNLRDKESTNIYNTIIPTQCNQNVPINEYIKLEKTLMEPYSYLYDCIGISPIKRITPNCIEYYEQPKDMTDIIVIKNYYDSPKIYKSINMKTNSCWIDISRNATKTQLKMEDIIQFFMKGE